LEYRNGARDLSGRDQAHAPRLQAGFELEYRQPTGYFARFDAQRQSAFYFSDSHDQRAVARTLVNARIGRARDRWEASLWVRNLLDRNYAQRGFFFGNEPPDYPDKLYVQQADPRQIGLSVRVELR
jgi:outer membrane receptor protein involved in Fe transport